MNMRKSPAKKRKTAVPQLLKGWHEISAFLGEPFLSGSEVGNRKPPLYSFPAFAHALG
jgi:hypothetical protein